VTIARSSRLGGAQSQGLTSARLGDWPRLPPPSVGACDDAARDPALSGVAQQTSSSLGRQQSDITTTSSIPQYGFSIDAPGADRSMHRVKNACHHEGRQG
jgi:hypothetical protein